MRYCGREFSQNDIEKIRTIIKESPEKHRTHISRIVCETFNWYKPDGKLKEMSCRVALLRMERDGLLVLPPPRTKNSNGKITVQKTSQSDPQPINCLPAGKITGLRIVPVTTRQESGLWNEYIDRYHYLGYKPLPGAQLRYMVYSENNVLALLGFGASAWKVSPRDNYIGWSHEQRKKNLQLIVNNARFLILPWVRSKNLASRILSIITKRLPSDWQQRYGYKPVLLETFVEQGRFHGTCYKAANWVYVGLTQGRGKMDSKNEYKLPKKYIYIYPLSKTFRKTLFT